MKVSPSRSKTRIDRSIARVRIFGRLRIADPPRIADIARTIGIAVFTLAIPAAALFQAPAIAAQEAFDLDAIPSEYEDTIRDLVERYEEMRSLLREQIQRNTDLYSQAEIDAAVADLEAEVLALETENAALRNDFKRLLVAKKNAENETERFKDLYAKTRSDLTAEITTLDGVISSIEEETLLQIGATFSPEGRLGGIGILNLPGSNVSLITEGLYDLREKRVTTAFGIGFGLLPQRTIVEGYHRLFGPTDAGEEVVE